MSDEAKGDRRGRKWMVICIVAVAAVSAAGWLRLHIDNSLEPLLPQHNQARQTILFLRDSTFADKAVLWFQLTGAGSLSDLIAAADATQKHLDPNLITRVIQPPSESSALDEAIGLLDHAGELLNESDLADLKNAAAPDALRKRMRDVYMQLVQPQGAFLQRIFRRDPLGISSRILSRLYALTNGLGFRVEIKDGHFVNPDGRQLIMVLETSTTATSLSSSEALVAHLQNLCDAAPPGIRITPICGQIHTVQNEQLMRRDIHMGGAINAIGFLLLFLLISRDWRVAAVFLLPLATTGLTIGLYALVHPNVSAMVIGLSVAMAGSAVDYGIYVYTAVRMGTDRSANMRRIRRPILISHLTTLGVFVAFVFSEVPAYRQLGYLTSVSLILSLLAALFVLPKMLKPGGRIIGLGSGMSLERWGKIMSPAVIVAAILVVAAIFISRKIKFDSDITRLDGVSPAVKQAESDFQKNWGQSDVQQCFWWSRPRRRTPPSRPTTRFIRSSPPICPMDNSYRSAASGPRPPGSTPTRCDGGSSGPPSEFQSFAMIWPRPAGPTAFPPMRLNRFSKASRPRPPTTGPRRLFPPSRASSPPVPTATGRC